MSLGFCPIASSSRGNSYCIRSENTLILLDAGLTGVKLRNAVKEMELEPEAFSGILVTHEHVDHVRGVKGFIKGCSETLVYGTRGTFESVNAKGSKLPEEKLCIIEKDQVFTIGDIEVTAFEISHDASEPVAFSFKKDGKKITIVTDTGTVTERINEAISDSDILVIESNHEVNILLYGSYPYQVKRRILSDVGHLSNEAAGMCITRYLKNFSKPNVPHVFLAHLSRENNTPQQAYLTVKNILEEEDFYIGKHLKLGVLEENKVGDLIVI